MKNPVTRVRSGGFTLVEVLLALAIFGVIASLRTAQLRR